MNKKKWFLLVVFCLAIIGYLKLFYKTFNYNSVPSNADNLVVLDVKRITNTIIYNYITTPNQWKGGSIFSTNSKDTGFKDVIVMPDYAVAFHIKQSPASEWYCMLQLKKLQKLPAVLRTYNFEKIEQNFYENKNKGITVFIKNTYALITNCKNIAAIDSVANNLFVTKQFANKAFLAKAINAKSHAAILISANGFLQADGVITANFNKSAVNINGSFIPLKQYDFTENTFAFSDTPLATIGFIQPSANVFALLSDTIKSKVNKALGFSIDNVLLPSNKSYQLHINGFLQRVDSAISYSYDNDFNKIETVTVNKIEEPSFNFTIIGDSIKNITNYWKQNNLVNASGLFTPMPFVKTYLSQKDSNVLQLTADNYKPNTNFKTIKSIFILQLLFSKIPISYIKYLPTDLASFLQPISSLQINLFKKENSLQLDVVLEKKTSFDLIIGQRQNNLMPLKTQ